MLNVGKLDNSESCQSVAKFVYLESVVRKKDNIYARIKRRLNFADVVAIWFGMFYLCLI